MVVVDDLILQRVRAAIESVDHKTQVRAAYLFGSRAAGTADEYSDIDVAAFLADAEQLTLERRIRLGVEVRELFDDEIEMHFLPAESLENPSPSSFAAFVLEHGIPIWERPGQATN